jgi:hypothetical protein
LSQLVSTPLTSHHFFSSPLSRHTLHINTCTAAKMTPTYLTHPTDTTNPLNSTNPTDSTNQPN